MKIRLCGTSWPHLALASGCASFSTPRRLRRGRHAAPWAVLPRLGQAWPGLAVRGVRSWPALALASSGAEHPAAPSEPPRSAVGCAATSWAWCAVLACACSCRQRVPCHKHAPKRLQRSRFTHGATAAGFIEKSQLHETRPKRLRRSRFPRAGGCLELQAAAMGFKVPVTVTH